MDVDLLARPDCHAPVLGFPSVRSLEEIRAIDEITTPAIRVLQVECRPCV